ncbi:MAG: bacteriohemerythrin, partial [Thermodesulfovibrionales bacterium]|nr:bacteriohemerythrin [Thermodesulfovibrionales bacterium]
TERKKAEEAIAQNEMFIRSILNSTEEPIMVINADYQILMMNDHARRNAKRFTDESAPVYCYKVSHHRDSPCSGEDHKCPLTEVIESGKPFSEFHIHKDEKGEERYVEVLASPITGEGGDVHAIVETCRDITKHIHTEKDLRQALVDRDTLIREIHHRVKNNLAVIQSLLSLQASHSPDESTKGILDESKNRVTAMSMIHERLYQSSDMSKVDFKEYIESLATLLFNNYRTQGLSIALRTDIPSLEIDIDTMIPCGLIVNELLSNALKYAFEPGDIAEIYIGVELDGKGRMHLVVRDNGKGLPDGFDIDQTTTLGMKLVSSLSRQIGSDVQILCEGGTEFRVLLLRHTLPPLIWDDNKYLTHNREIDMQHRKLLEAISSLKDAILSGRNEEGLQQIIPKLLEYVELHFKTEEDHMRALGYPKQDEHIAAHRDFTSKVNSVIADIKRGKTGLSLSVYDFLATWLKKHVAGIDMDLGEFLAEKGMTDTDAPV